MTTELTTPGWYPDPMARHELRYHDGTSWTDHVSSAGVQSTDLDVQSDTAQPEAAQASDPAFGLPMQKRRLMAFVTLGCAAVMALAVFLPWGTGTGGSASGADIGLGYLTGLCAIGLAGYGYNALHAPVVRYHPGALTAIIITVLTAALVNEGLEKLDSVTFGVGEVRAGIGLNLTLLAPLVAIWPLVVFWKDYRAQLARRRMVAAGALAGP